MNGFKKSLIALMLSAGFIANASATTTSIEGVVGVGAFEKTYSFTISSGFVGEIFGSFVSKIYTVTSTPIAGFEINLVSLNSNTLPLSTTSTTNTLIDADDDLYLTSITQTFSNTALSSGAYTLKISGVGYSDDFNLNGAFSVAQTAAPVPEPTELGMLMLGLGLLAFVSRRKSA